MTKMDRNSMNVPFADAMSPEAVSRLRAAMEPVRFKKGQRFITQGREGDSLYFIETGCCSVNLEKSSHLHPVAVLSEGDIVGEMALLTGENRSAHVDAQTDIGAWRLGRDEFERVCEEFPEIRQFLTQIVSTRFARSNLTADRTIGKYVITEILGRGGWSIVYKGTHTTLNMPVAIKMLKHHMAMDKDFIREFQNEARIIANLNHENIVKVYDIEQLYRTVFIVMEYLEGASVEQILRENNSIPIPDALHIIQQVCAGLAFAHEKGIIHRDVKPGNIFVRKDNTAKLVDFGLACTVGTVGARVVGTPKYLSPEQIRGQPVDARSDIYSLGLSAFKMITGCEAFSVMDIATLLHMQLYEDIPDPATLTANLPDELRRFIVRATRKNPEDRYQCMSEIMQDLAPLLTKLGLNFSMEPQRNTNMAGLFIFYRDEQEPVFKRLLKDFTEELKKAGAVLKEADFKNIR